MLQLQQEESVTHFCWAQQGETERGGRLAIRIFTDPAGEVRLQLAPIVGQNPTCNLVAFFDALELHVGPVLDWGYRIRAEQNLRYAIEVSLSEHGACTYRHRVLKHAKLNDTPFTDVVHVGVKGNTSGIDARLFALVSIYDEWMHRESYLPTLSSAHLVIWKVEQFKPTEWKTTW